MHLLSTGKIYENCLSPIKEQSLPTEGMKVSPRELSHVRYFQRELTHYVGCTALVQNPSVQTPFSFAL